MTVNNNSVTVSNNYKIHFVNKLYSSLVFDIQINFLFFI